MDIRNVANHGKVERSSDRTKKSELPTVVIPSATRDQASISTDGRATAASVEGFAERARAGGRDRDEVVAGALRKLASGELDGAAALDSTARRLLDAKFLGV
jgi:hypothetical protein